MLKPNFVNLKMIKTLSSSSKQEEYFVKLRLEFMQRLSKLNSL